MFEIDILINEIEKANQKVNINRESSVALVIGRTGAGKSTMVAYLQSIPLLENDEGKAILASDTFLEKAPKIGGSAASVTLYPSTYAVKKDLVLCDCPGFEDNRGDELRIAISVAMERAIEQAKEIKAILVVIDYAAIDMERGRHLRDVSFTLSKLFSKPEAFQQSLIFVINRYPRKMTEEKILNKIKDLIRSEEENLSRIKLNLTAEKDEIEQVEKKIVLLKLLNEENMLFADVFDNGESREKVFSKIEKSPFIQKTQINADAYDSIRKNFNHKIIQDVTQAIEKIQTLNKNTLEQDELNQQKQKIEEKLREEEKEVSELRSKSSQTRSVFERNSKKVIGLKEKIQEVKTQIKQSESNIRKNENQMKEFEKELYSLDTDAKTLYQTLCPPVWEKGLFSRNKQIFRYNDIPYLSVERTYYNGQIKYEQQDPKAGTYYSEYTGDIGGGSSATIKIYAEKRLIPENAKQIVALKDKIKTCQNDIDFCKTKKAKCEQIISSKELEIEIEFNNHKIESSNTQKRLEASIAQARKKHEELCVRIEQGKNILNTEEKIIINNLSYYKKIFRLSHAIDFEKDKKNKKIQQLKEQLGVLTLDASFQDKSADTHSSSFFHQKRTSAKARLKSAKEVERAHAIDFFVTFKGLLTPDELYLLRRVANNDTSYIVRIVACEALYLNGVEQDKKSSCRMLLELLKYPGFGMPHQEGAELVRERATKAFLTLKEKAPEIINELSFAANDVFEEVGKAATEALRAIGEENNNESPREPVTCYSSAMKYA